MAHILIIEDEAAIRRVLTKILQEEDKSYKISEADNGISGVQIAQNEAIDMVLCDIKMPKMDGVEVLQELRQSHPSLPVVMISGHGDLETAVACMRLGAFDYISKPPDLNRLINAVRGALKSKDASPKIKKTISTKKSDYTMVGNSEAMEEIYRLIEKVAPTNARILITGPNGSGKELVAHSIHEQSLRNSGPFIEVNCAAIPSELIESELFGHVKGSFTSAVKDRAGKFEAANGGTIFLDEIGDMSFAAQAKVLRALQEHKVQRVGSDKDISVDVRVLAATNKNLILEIQEQRFREDLFHRLAVIEIAVPPLNQRRSDIPLLVDFFITQMAKEHKTTPKKIHKSALVSLQKHQWPGNVRQLRNVVERLLILAGDEITKEDVEKYVN